MRHSLRRARRVLIPRSVAPRAAFCADNGKRKTPSERLPRTPPQLNEFGEVEQLSRSTSWQLWRRQLEASLRAAFDWRAVVVVAGSASAVVGISA